MIRMCLFHSLFVYFKSDIHKCKVRWSSIATVKCIREEGRLHPFNTLSAGESDETEQKKKSKQDVIKILWNEKSSRKQINNTQTRSHTHTRMHTRGEPKWGIPLTCIRCMWSCCRARDYLHFHFVKYRCNLSVFISACLPICIFSINLTFVDTFS